MNGNEIIKVSDYIHSYLIYRFRFLQRTTSKDLTMWWKIHFSPRQHRSKLSIVRGSVSFWFESKIKWSCKQMEWLPSWKLWSKNLDESGAPHSWTQVMFLWFTVLTMSVMFFLIFLIWICLVFERTHFMCFHGIPTYT